MLSKSLWLVFLVYIVAAAALTWPIAVSGDAFDHADTLFNSWLLHWNGHAATTLQNPLTPPIFQGYGDAAGRNDLLLTQSIVGLPMVAGGIDAIRIHNIVFILSMAFAGYAVHLLARDLRLTEAGSWFAGMSFLFLPFFQSHMWHLQLMSAGLTILCIRQALGFLQGERSGFGVSLLVLLQGAASLYYWYFLDIALFLMVAWVFFTTLRRRAPALIGWIILGNLLLIPLLLGHISNAQTWPTNTVTSTDVAAYVSPWHSSIVLNGLRQPWLLGEAALLPGITVLVGALFWLVTRKHADRIPCGSYLLVILVFFAFFCLGPTLVFWRKEVSPAPFRFLGWLPGIGSIRLPARAAFLFLLPLVLAAGKTFGRRTWLAASAVLLCLIEVYPGPIELHPAEIGEYNLWIADMDFENVLILPVDPSLERPERECMRLYGSTLHHTPMVNGYSTSLPEGYVWRSSLLNTWPADSAQNLAKWLNVECVICEGWIDSSAVMVWDDGRQVISAVILD